MRNTDAFLHRVIRRRHTCLYLFACGCVCELFSGTVHMDTWVERDIRMRSCGSACDGASPATVRDADHALAVAATPKHLRTSKNRHMHILACACACHVLEVMGLHLSRSAMRTKFSLSCFARLAPVRHLSLRVAGAVFISADATRARWTATRIAERAGLPVNASENACRISVREHPRGPICSGIMYNSTCERLLCDA